jgi:hypothetical protein
MVRPKLLFGPYQAPRFRYGSVVLCEVRGWQCLTGLSSAPIPWPTARGKRGRPYLVVYGSLAKAVRRESNLAVAYWWGVTPQTVSAWRKALGVGPTTAGTSARRRDAAALTIRSDRAEAKRRASYTDPQRNERIAAAKLGKPRPAHVRAALDAGRALSQTPEARRKRSESHKRRGTVPPAAVDRNEKDRSLPDRSPGGTTRDRPP